MRTNRLFWRGLAACVLTLVAGSAAAYGTAGGAAALAREDGRERGEDVNRPNPLSRTYRAELRGGLVAAGCGLRATGPPEAAGTITIAGIPADATVKKAILNWTIMDSFAPPSSDVTFHEIASTPKTFAGALLGSDQSPCWASGLEFIYGFTLDVTAEMTATGNGTYQVEVPDSGAIDTPPSAEGAALLVVYGSPSSPATDVVIYEGVESQIVGGSIQDVDGFDVGLGLTFADAVFVVADGQGRTNGWSGWGRVNGTDVVTPLWDADEGQNCTNGVEFYDVDTISIVPLIASGDTSLTAEVEGGDDCLTWSAFAVAVPTDTIANNAPICDAGAPYLAECSGQPTDVALDGTGSSDPDGDPLDYFWTTTCPGGRLDDPVLDTPTLSLDSPPPCPVDCDVTLLVTDPDGLTDRCSAPVTVEDTTAPVLIGVPADATVECDAVPAAPAVTAADTCDPAPTVVFAEVKIDGRCPGEYTLERTWTATDICGNITSQTQTLSVVDTTPPVVTPADDDIACLWPPNHRYVCFAASEVAPAVADNCSEPITWEFAGCTVDQPDDAPDPAWPGWNGDGSTTNDCLVSGDGGTVCVRSERAGGGPTAQDGRHYGLQIVAVDACGNASDLVPIGDVTVPHDRDRADRLEGCLDPTKVGCRNDEPVPCDR